MGKPKMYRSKPVAHADLSVLLDTALGLLNRRFRTLTLKMSGVGLTDCERAEFVEVEALLRKRDAIFDATLAVPRNQTKEKKWTPGPKTSFHDPAPMKNPLVQRAVLARRVKSVRFSSDNPVGNTDADDLPPVEPGSSMSDTDKPPWE